MAKLLKDGESNTRDYGDAITDDGGVFVVVRGSYRRAWPSHLGPFTIEDGTAPTPISPAVSKWSGCRPLPVGDFIGVVSAALAAHYVVLRADAAFIPIWDIISVQGVIDPFDKEGDFTSLVAKMKATDLASAPGTKMLTTAQEDAIIAAWKLRQR